jgi:hypothetical protein
MRSKIFVGTSLAIVFATATYMIMTRIEVNTRAQGLAVRRNPIQGQPTIAASEKNSSQLLQSEPIVASYARLKSNAMAGDAASASALFNKVRTCIRAGVLDAAYRNAVQQRDWLMSVRDRAANEGAQVIAARDAQIAKAEADMDRITSADQICKGAENMNDGRIYAIAMQAASLGDHEAQACVLQASYAPPANIDLQEGEAYRDNAYRYAENGIESGSWPVVMALALSSGGGNNTGGYAAWTSHYNMPKLLQYKRLLRLGTTNGSPEAQRLDKQIVAIENAVTEDERDAASKWSNQIYRKYFFFSGPVSPYSIPCSY